MNKIFKLVLGIGVLILALGVIWNAAKGRESVKRTTTPSPSLVSSTNTPTVEVVFVRAQALKTITQLPGEISAYQDVAIYPRVQGFIDWIGVDRGSKVKRGELLARLNAPELIAQLEGAQAKVQSTHARLAEMRAKLAALESTYQKLKTASMTPGVVAGNDVVLAEKQMEAARAELRSIQGEERAANDAANSVKDLVSYLKITAPFDGMITERNAHTGSLVGPSSPSPILRIQSLLRLRLTVSVPEKDLSGILPNKKVRFTVPAFPNKVFQGVIRRIAHSLDVKTRTMPVELDVSNESGELAPGMYAQVEWPIGKKRLSLFVPSSSIVTTTERVFVIRIRNGAAEWINIKPGEIVDDWTEVFGGLHQGDEVVLHGSDELRSGTPVTIQSIKAKP